MNKERNVVFSLVIIVISISLLVGCNAPTSQSTPTSTPTLTPPPTPTEIPTPTATPTPSPGDIVLEGDELLEKSDFDGAVNAYQRALEIDDGYGRAHAGLIYAHLWQRSTSSQMKGLELAEEAAKTYPENAAIQIALAWAYIVRDFPAQALEAAQVAVELDPSDAMAQAVLGGAYLLDRQFDSSIEAIEESISLDGDLAYAYFTLGNYYRDTADFARAIAAFEYAIQLQPKFVYWRSSLGSNQLNLNNLDEADEQFEAALEIVPDNIYALAGLAISAMSRMDYAAAEEWIDKAKRVDDQETVILKVEGDLAKMREEYDDALDYYKQALEIDEGDSGAMASMGFAYLAQDDCTQAEEQFRELARIYPKKAEAPAGHGWAEFCDGNDLNALHKFREALDLDPYNAKAYLGMAAAYTTQLRWEEAYEELANALQYSASPAAIHYVTASMFQFEGLLREAEAEYSLAKELNPFIEGVYLGLSELFYIQDEHERALAEIEEGLALDPENKKFRSNQGMLYYYLGELDKSRQVLEGVLDEDPEDELSNLFLGLTYRDQREYSKAKMQLDRYSKLMSGLLGEEQNMMLEIQIYMLDQGYPMNEERAIEEMQSFLENALGRSPSISIEDREEDGRTMIMIYRLPGSVASAEEAGSHLRMLLYTTSLFMPRIIPEIENGSEIQILEGGRTVLSVLTSLDVHKKHADGLLAIEDLLLETELLMPGSSQRRPSIDRISRDVAVLRELTAQEQVPSQQINQDDLRDELIEGIDEQVREDIKRDWAVLSLMGVISPSMDLEGVWVDLYTESIVGYYDPEEKSIYYLAQDERTLLDDMTIAHEYVHALQDQNFGLETLKENSKNDDEMMAIGALIEGDATLAMYQYAEQNVSPEDLLESISAVSGIEIDEVDQTPPYIISLATFPYSKGLEFVLAVYNRNGTWEDVDAAYTNPPVSTEHILHPETYFAGEEPVPVTIPELDDEISAGWEVVDDEVMGEYGIRLFLAEHSGPNAGSEAAQGWGGDRYIVLYNAESDTYALVFSTTWDDQDEADDFWGIFRAAMANRAGYKEIVETLTGELDYRCWQGELDTACAYQDGQDVFMVISPDQDFVMAVVGVFQSQEASE